MARMLKQEGTEYTEHDGRVGGGQRIANRDGIFKVKFTKAWRKRQQFDKWFVPVLQSPDETNVAFCITTTGPAAEDAGYTRSNWMKISGKFGPDAKRKGQARTAIIRDILRSVGLSTDQVTKLLPLGKPLNEDKLERIFNKYVDGKEGYVGLLSKEQDPDDDGKVHWTSDIYKIVSKETAEATITSGSHTTPLRGGAKKYAENGAMSTQSEPSQDNLDGEDLGDDDDFGDIDDDLDDDAEDI